MSSPDQPPRIEKQDYEVASMLLQGQESDRGCVIFCAAMLEDELESLLRANCRQDPGAAKKIVDPLFRGYGPFSTFSAKIQVSYALGLIPEYVYKALDLIRKLRNDFAHEKAAVSFQSTKYHPRLRAILDTSSPEGPSDWRPSPDDEEKLPHMGTTTRRQFVERLAFCFCVTRISAQIRVSRVVASRMARVMHPAGQHKNTQR
jgi:DNA-binding MltR family transcriptional regulator